MSHYQGNIFLYAIKSNTIFGSLQIVWAANSIKKANIILVASLVKN